MKKIYVALLIVLLLVFVGCKKEDKEYDEYGIMADNEVLEKSLKKIILGYEYKRLTENFKLPNKANGEYGITWEVSENDYASIEKLGKDEFILVDRHETDFIHFTLKAIIEDEDGDKGERIWECYIAPLIYKEEERPSKVNGRK